MDMSLQDIDVKSKVLADVKEVLTRILIESTSETYMPEGIDYPICGLYDFIKRQILSSTNSCILNEIKQIKPLGDNYVELAICSSAKKIVALPEMTSLIFELKDGICEATASFTSILHDNLLKDMVDGNQFEISGSAASIHGSPRIGLNLNPLDKPTIGFTGRKSKDEVALSNLSKASLAEIFETPCWANSKSLLRRSLLSESQSVFFRALQLQSRFLLSPSNIAVTESFLILKTCLLECLSKFRSENELNLMKGLDISKFSHVRLLKLVHLMLEFFRDRSKNYVRLPLKLMEGIIAHMIDLMVLLSGNFSVVLPYHLISILDPNAQWLKTCFYFTYVRNLMIHKLKKTPQLIKLVSKTIILWMNEPGVGNYNFKDTSNIVICENKMKFAGFLHSLNIYLCLMTCDEGRNILWNFDRGIMYQEILKSIVVYLNKPSCSRTVTILVSVLKRMLAFPHVGFLYNLMVGNMIMNPLYQVYQEITRNTDSYSVDVAKPWLIHLITALVTSKIGRDKFILSQNYKCGLEQLEICPARLFLHYTCKILKRAVNDESCILRNLLTICAQLSLSPKGVMELEVSDLMPLLAIVYCQLKTQLKVDSDSNTLILNDLSSENLVLDSIKGFLISFASNSNNIWLLEKESILYPLLHECYNQPLLHWNSRWFQKLVISSLLTNNGYNSLLGQQVKRVFLDQLWKSCRLSSNELWFHKNALEEASSREINSVLNLCSTIRGVKALLMEMEGSESTLTEGMNLPSSLQEILEITLGPFHESQQQASRQDVIVTDVDPNEVHFGLRLLRFLVSNLDVNLLLENKLLFQV